MAPAPVAPLDCTLLVAGGGLGGVAAALRATALGCDVVLAEPASVLGGAMTAQGVSLLDEHALIDEFGGTALYYELRRQIREYYRPHLKLALRMGDRLPNPGAPRRQAPLAFEPKAGLAAIERLTDPARKAGALKVLLRTRFAGVERSEDGRLTSVTVESADAGRTVTIQPRYVIDATDPGDIMALAGLPYRVGIESFSETGEPSAPATADRTATQAFTYTFAVEFRPGEDHVIPKPPLYDELRRTHPFTLNGRTMFPQGKGTVPFLSYRRIIYAHHFASPEYRHDVSLINWMSTDYHEETLIDQPDDAVRVHTDRARQLALSFLYWLQTEAPRDDGGKGYPELKLRPDVMGTADGLAEQPYTRESRRLVGLATIREQDLVAGYNCGVRARLHPDAVAIGWYPYVDIHRRAHVTHRRGSGQRVQRYQIPLSALVTEEAGNFAAGGRTISMTHIANGAVRFHPVEWNTGEAAGALCALAAKAGRRSVDFALDLGLLRRLQRLLLTSGIPLYWFCDVPIGHPAFFAAQYLAVCGVVQAAGLDFAPDDPMSPAEAEGWIAAARHIYGLKKTQVADLSTRSREMTRGGVAAALCDLILPAQATAHPGGR